MIKYPASYTRMRALKGRLLKKDYLTGLLQMSDIHSISSALDDTVYGEQIRNAEDLNQIEHGLKQDLIISYIKILVFLKGRPARFLEALLGKFELLNLKSIIRWLAGGPESRSVSELGPFVFSLGKYHTIPIEEALKADDLESLMELMKNTPFARPLEIGYQQYLEAASESIDARRLFPMELALDLDYYERLWSALEALGPFDRYNAGRLLGIRYDTINLVWILRFKQYYNFSPEQIIQYTIPRGWRIRGDILREVIDSDDLMGSIKALRVSPYDNLLKSITQVDGSLVLGIELGFLRYLYRESVEAFTKFPLQAAPLLAFFICKEMQIRDIITVLAGRNLGLSQERTRSYMVTL